MADDNMIQFPTDEGPEGEPPEMSQAMKVVLETLDGMPVPDQTKALAAALTSPIAYLVSQKLAFSSAEGAVVINGEDFAIAIRTFNKGEGAPPPGVEADPHSSKLTGI